MSQSKNMSLTETITSTGIGLAVSLVSTSLAFHVLGMAVSFQENAELTLFLTVISLIRGYCVRRLFNYLGEKEFDEHEGGGIGGTA